jgi:hypothetical protein
VLATDGKRLAWRSAGNQVNPTIPSLEILIVNISLDQRPMAHKLESTALVGPNGLARVAIVFENRVMLEARVRRGNRKSASAHK